MSSLTIRLDENTESLLNYFVKTTQQTKSELVRESLETFLKQKKQLEQQKNDLSASFSVNNKNEVAKRISESEASYHLTDEEYEKEMDDFFANEIGLIR